MYEDLKIVIWPDPRLLKICAPVTQFDDDLRELSRRMFALMREARGVGLAAPQVGKTVRMFVMNATGKPEDDRVYVNPLLTDIDGEDEAEEGCLSLPDINIDVVRTKTVRIAAQDLEGVQFEQEETGYLARVWQHEFDHLNGKLLTDRMGPVARIANRRKLKELEEQYAAQKAAMAPKSPKPRRAAPKPR